MGPGDDRAAGQRWSDVLAELIASGHDIDRISRYTLRQIAMHYEAAQRRQQEMRARRVEDMAIAQSTGKAIQDWIATLRRTR